jgi:hypothetical protein
MSNKRKIRPPEPVIEGSAGAVAFAYIFNRIEPSFHHSMIQMLGWDAEHEGRVWRGGIIARRGTTGNLPDDRNRAVAEFLAEDKAEWLLWCDTDMGFEADAIDRLVAAADPTARPIVGGLCFAQREEESDGAHGFRPIAWPVLMDWTVVEGRGGFSTRWDYPRNALTQCHGIGSAFVLIHRTVFERMRDVYEEAQREAGTRQDGDRRWADWYTRVTNPTTRELVGEDLSFCARLMRLEIPVHVHTGIQTTHRKDIWLQEEDYWRQRAVAPAPETVEPIPVAERAAYRFAVVPTHNRPDRLLSLVTSLNTQADTIIVLDNASDPPVDHAALQAAADKTSVSVLSDPEQPPNLSRFWNVLFDWCAEASTDLERWDVAVFNDDAQVPAGWYDTVSTALRGHETAVVAHTGTVALHREDVVTTVDYERHRRMCPWAFVVKGEAGLRSDESMRWWYFDDDFNRRAALAGGVLAVPGPLVVNSLAVQSTTGVLAEQADRDRATFEKKWADR